MSVELQTATPTLESVLASFKEMRSNLSLLEKQTIALLKQQKSEAKAASKKTNVPKDPNAPKRTISASVAAWNVTVQETLTDMKANGWSAHSTPKGVVISASTKTEAGAYVFADTGKAPTYKNAMSFASSKKKSPASTPPATPPMRPIIMVNKVLEIMTGVKVEVPAVLALPEAAAPVAKEDAKAAKAAAKAAKAATKAAAKAAKTTAKTPAVTALPASAAGAVNTPTPAPEQEEEISFWTFRGQTYIRTSENECWLATEDGSIGQWVGVYDPTTDKIDETAEEPERC